MPSTHLFRALRHWPAWLVLLGAATAWAADDAFLPPEQAFAFSAREVAPGQVALHWAIAPGYHLYQERLGVEAPAPATLAPLQLPPARAVFDRNFNRDMPVYEHALDVPVQVHAAQANHRPELRVRWQGCADAGLCYPPAEAVVALAQAVPVKAAAAPATRPDAQSSTPTAALDVSLESVAQTLASGSLWRTAVLFGLAGLLLSLTPCVLPMVPILSSLIAGQRGTLTRRRGLALAAAYALGMSLVYAAFGVAAGLAGEGLAAALQNAWVLGGFALLLAVLALSMFGVYELQMPAAIQQRAMGWSNRLPAGQFAGVALMGGLSAVLVGPCVAAPLAGALLYIGQTGDVLLGATALFAMAWGMSVPLLLVGASAGSLLPRAGAWMEQVRRLFGMVLLAVAISLVAPVLPAPMALLLWAAWLLGVAAWLGLFGQPRAAGTAAPGVSPARVLGRAAGTAAGLMAALLLVGAASGGQSVLQPLAHLRAGAAVPAPNATAAAATTAAATPANTNAGTTMARVADLPALEQELQRAAQRGQRVLLDVYADWCLACKELEAFTLRDPEVQTRLRQLHLVQADVTRNTTADRALLKRFGLFGPPGLVLLDGTATPPGNVLHTVVGYQDAKTFLAGLDRAMQRNQR